MRLVRLPCCIISIVAQLCLSSSNLDYTEVGENLNWDVELNELDTITTDVPVELSFKNIVHDEIAAETKVNELSAVLKSTIHRIRQQYKKMDIVFLIDSSSSVGKSNFRSELRFVIKFLSDFNVSFNYTRVSIVTFSSQEKIVRNI